MCPSKEQGYKDYKKLDTESIPLREPATPTPDYKILSLLITRNKILRQ